MTVSVKKITKMTLVGLSLFAASTAFAQQPQENKELPKELHGPQRVITIKCQELKGKKAAYGSLTNFFSNKETLEQGVVNWTDTRYEGAWPTIVLTDFAQGSVLFNREMTGATFEKRGVNRFELLAMLRDKEGRGMVVRADMKPGSKFLQFVASAGEGRNGVDLYTLDEKNKILMHNRAKYYDDMEGGRSVESWVFTSKCEWYEDKITFVEIEE